MTSNDNRSETCDARDCETFSSATVEFSDSTDDSTRAYCDRCMRHLLEMRVNFRGVVEHA